MNNTALATCYLLLQHWLKLSMTQSTFSMMTEETKTSRALGMGDLLWGVAGPDPRGRCVIRPQGRYLAPASMVGACSVATLVGISTSPGALALKVGQRWVTATCAYGEAVNLILNC